MYSPRTCWQRWTSIFQEKEAGTSLALFRLAVGSTVLATLSWIIGKGLAPAIWLDAQDGGYRTLAPAPWLFELLGGVTPATLWPMLAVALVSGVCLTVGVFGRLSAFVLLQSYHAVSSINGQTSGCDDQLIVNALWLLVLSRSTATLSLACRLRTGAWSSSELVPAWPRYLAIFQMIVVYFATGLQKASLSWLPFGDHSALYYILQDPSWQRFDMSWLAWIYPLTQLATATTWLWEVSAPLLGLALWCGNGGEGKTNLVCRFGSLLHSWNFRRYYVLMGLGMHLGIWLLMGLGTFTWISWSFYICLYAPWEWSFFRRPPAMGDVGGAAALASGSRLNGAWGRWLVPGFVAYHVLGVSLGALPVNLPPANEYDRAEAVLWCGILADFDLQIAPEELQQRVLAVAKTCVGIQDYLTMPFKPYYKYCGTTQGWPMFSGSGLHAQRVFIDIQENGSWRTVYVQGVPEHAWLRWLLHDEHLRAGVYRALTPKENGKGHEDMARWLARRAAADFPDAARLRIKVMDFPIPSPEEVREDRRPAGMERIIADIPL